MNILWRHQQTRCSVLGINNRSPHPARPSGIRMIKSLDHSTAVGILLKRSRKRTHKALKNRRKYSISCKTPDKLFFQTIFALAPCRSFYRSLNGECGVRFYFHQNPKDFKKQEVPTPGSGRRIQKSAKWHKS